MMTVVGLLALPFCETQIPGLTDYRGAEQRYGRAAQESATAKYIHAQNVKLHKRYSTVRMTSNHLFDRKHQTLWPILVF